MTIPATESKKASFKTTVLLAGKTATGIVVPDEVVTSLGAGKKPPVCITIKNYIYRNTIAVMGGVFMVGISAEHRAAAGIAAGEEIEVQIELDTAPRVVEVPQDLQKELDNNDVARQNFETLSYSNKRRLVLPIEDAKTDETRQRRIANALAELSAAKKKSP
jgi:hypothetical protein